MGVVRQEPLLIVAVVERVDILEMAARAACITATALLVLAAVVAAGAAKPRIIPPVVVVSIFTEVAQVVGLGFLVLGLTEPQEQKLATLFKL
jgi:hypothetical protein